LAEAAGRVVEGEGQFRRVPLMFHPFKRLRRFWVQRSRFELPRNCVRSSRFSAWLVEIVEATKR